ncbi:helix-turn-helix domain-containing protein [Leucobacter sp. cx-169]|nr:helix-turn-helix domain-containing protein [Leucobacter sp. cx-169]
MSIATLARLSKTSRSAIAAYEDGSKHPRVDTAARILATLGRELTAVKVDLEKTRIDQEIIRTIESSYTGFAQAYDWASESVALIVDADVNAEGLPLGWGTVKTLVYGTTISTDEPLAGWRLQELAGSVRSELNLAREEHPPDLTYFARDSVVHGMEDGPSVRRAADFLVRAIAAGGDATFVQHRASAFLTHFGYPWLYVPHRLAREYRAALVVCRRFGDGNPLLRVLAQSIQERGF